MLRNGRIGGPNPTKKEKVSKQANGLDSGTSYLSGRSPIEDYLIIVVVGWPLLYIYFHTVSPTLPSVAVSSE